MANKINKSGIHDKRDQLIRPELKFKITNQRYPDLQYKITNTGGKLP